MFIYEDDDEDRKLICVYLRGFLDGNLIGITSQGKDMPVVEEKKSNIVSVYQVIVEEFTRTDDAGKDLSRNFNNKIQR